MSVVISYIFNVISFSNNLQKPRSCLQAWNQGARTSGFYLIQGRTECLFYEMYCDFSSEPGWAWTLVMSQGFGNRGNSFAKSPFLKGVLKNQRTPNWEKYRIGKGRMWVIKESSSHWRVTCDFPNFGVDFRDYLRAAFQNLNPIKFEASGKCCKMDYIDIRGHNCTGCTAAWWQNDQRFLTHFSDQDECQFGKTPGSGANEANFGGYCIGRAIPTSHFVVPVQKDQPQIIGLEAGCSRGEGSGNAKFSFDYGKISVCTFFSHCRSSDVTSENSSFRMSRYCCGVF